MADVTVLRELLERVEKATGPDREIDCALLEWQGWSRNGKHMGQPRWVDPSGNQTAHSPAHGPVYRYTASIDAAVALVERVLPGWGMSIELAPGSHASVDLSGPEFCDADMSQWASSKVLSPPRAILSALLLVLISQAEGEGADHG